MHMQIKNPSLQNIILRDLRPEDIPLIWHYNFEAADREFHNWNGPYHPVVYVPEEEYAKRYHEDLLLVNTTIPRRNLVIEINGELKGTVGRYWVDKATNWCEIGIVIYDSSYWSGGYGTIAFQSWIDYLFTEMNVVRLGISTWSGNERMMRLAQKCGMQEEGRIRQARIVRGAYYDSIKMGILRSEWQAKRS
ncbi:N-acetyltransferase [Brevibacillus laterosporus]|uniref:GNAT family N-acetyltransferase n=1 Tax=Brevibacillus laterosporus TaxID=1465 RepID=UPI000CE2B9D8|nr:GNAT family protein [Brevibacillus laterosporus]PPA83037.1 N-acetyltransferase [Brevibacillus laterosporus]